MWRLLQTLSCKTGLRFIFFNLSNLFCIYTHFFQMLKTSAACFRCQSSKNSEALNSCCSFSTSFFFFTTETHATLIPFPPPFITEPKASKNIPLIQHILVNSAPLGRGQISWGWNIRKNKQIKAKFAHIERSPHSWPEVFIKTLLEEPHGFTVLHVWI